MHFLYFIIFQVSSTSIGLEDVRLEKARSEERAAKYSETGDSRGR